MDSFGINDPGSVLGVSALIDNDEDELDLAALEQEVTSGVKLSKSDPLASFQSEIDRLADDKNSNPMEDRFPARSVLVDEKQNQFIRKPGNKKDALAELLAEVDSDSGISSDDEPITIGRTHNKRTDDQKKSQIANRALSGVKEIKEFDLQKENEEDEKATLLEEIDILVEILTEEEVDISRIQIPDQKCSLEDIMKIRHHLRLKNDRSRSRAFAEETFMAGSHGLEYMFDGKKTYFGRRPDLTGWSDTVNIKLRRMRYDTSSFVNNIMRQYNFGPGTRIMIELVPSMFLYSRKKKKQHGDNLYTSDQMNDAMDRLRDIQEGDNE